MKTSSRRLAVVDEMSPGRVVEVHSADGTRIHTEVFGPDDGYPIVLAHGITCAIRVWANQIADLSRDHKVIAYDHRGHGRSGVPRCVGGGTATASTSSQPISTPCWPRRWRPVNGP